MSELILQVQPVTQPLIYFWRVTAAQAGKEYLMNLKFQLWGPNQRLVLGGEWAALHQILGVHTTIIDAPHICFDFTYVASFGTRVPQSQLCAKFGNICKNYGGKQGGGKMSE